MHKYLYGLAVLSSSPNVSFSVTRLKGGVSGLHQSMHFWGKPVFVDLSEVWKTVLQTNTLSTCFDVTSHWGCLLLQDNYRVIRALLWKSPSLFWKQSFIMEMDNRSHFIRSWFDSFLLDKKHPSNLGSQANLLSTYTTDSEQKKFWVRI